MDRDIRVLALPAYPELAAATRFRLLQYLPLLAEQGIEVVVHPFLTNEVFATLYERRHMVRSAGGMIAGAVRRIGDTVRMASWDIVWVQAQSAPLGPPVMEWLAHRWKALVFDLDDATYIDRRSSVFGPLATLLKGKGKVNRILRFADHAVCGNPTVAAYVGARGVPTTVLPTIVDGATFCPSRGRAGGDLVLGWVGTHSTFEYLLTLVPIFRRLAESHRFRLCIVGSGCQDLRIEGVSVEMRKWTLEREVEDLQSLDVAVYPIAADEWAHGKSGFKAIQYLSCGIPYVASPVGVVADIGVPGETHLEARTEEEWYTSLSRLLSDAALREAMGKAGRAYALRSYSTHAAALTLAEVFRSVANAARARD